MPSNPNDISQAAGRLRRVKAGDAYVNVYAEQLRADGMDGSFAVACSLADEDRHTLADAYLAELDETPADEAWIASLGLLCTDVTPLRYRDYQLYAYDSLGPYIRVVDAVDDVPAGVYVFLGGCARIKNPARGQVRTAARLFGITLKETR